MKKRISLSLLFTVIMAFCLILTPLAADLPSPSDDFYVNDFANVLSEEAEQHILDINDRLQPETGAQIVVVSVDFLGRLNSEEYCHQLFNQWGIGSSEKNNGVLFMISPGDETFWITVGRGLETTLSSGKLSMICGYEEEEYFDDGDYDRFVTEVFDGVAELLADHYNVSLSGNSGTVSLPQYNNYYEQEYESDGSGILTLIFLFIVLLIIVSLLRSWLRAFGPTATYRPRTPTPPPPRVHHIPYHSPKPTIHHRPQSPRPPTSFGGSSMNIPSSFGGFGSTPRSSSSSRSSFGGSSGRAPRSGGGGGSRGGGFGRK